MRRPALGLAPLLLGALVLAAAAAVRPALAGPPRHLAVVLDTSTSMRSPGNDEPRLAIQAIKILADMLGPDDALTVAWMPAGAQCRLVSDDSIRLDLRGGDRAAFEQALEDRAIYRGATNFIVPLATARAALADSSAMERLLIVISDAGRDSCRADSNRVLKDLRATGVHTAFVGVGSSRPPVHNQYDTATAATSPSELLQAIGTIYQRFLGAKAPDSGTLSPGSDRVSAEVAPFVGEAFLLVAAEGPVGSLLPEPGNPGAEGVDPDHRSGATRGLDEVTRGYRILRLRRPQAGTWGFRVTGLTGEAGWYLIQDFSVALRVESPPAAAQGEDVLLHAELVDEGSGRRIESVDRIPGLAIEALVEGTAHAFRDDGQGGDSAAGDGLLTARVRFLRPGPAAFPVRLASRYLQDERIQRIDVSAAAWALEVLTPARVFAGESVAVAVRIRSPGPSGTLRPPERVDARMGEGETIRLADAGRDGDAAAGDGIYARTWEAARPAVLDILYRAEGGGESQVVRSNLEVRGTLAFGTPGVLDLGRLTPRSVGESVLDLGFVAARGRSELEIAGDFPHRGAELEIDLGAGFVPLEGRNLPLVLEEGGTRQLPIRLRVGRCPAGVAPGRAGTAILRATDHLGQPLRADVPVRVEIVQATWLACWWPVLAAVALAILAAFGLYGILSPARFPRSLGIVLSPERDMGEGIPFHIRSQKGSGSGFYRDARLWISSDYRLLRSPRGALARLRADRLGVYLLPLPGQSVLELDAESRWEPLPADRETRARFSTLYKDAAGTLYFEFRNL